MDQAEEFNNVVLDSLRDSSTVSKWHDEAFGK
jgi:hypothetical protein